MLVASTMKEKRESRYVTLKPDALRSRIMRNNKSRGNLSTELRFLRLLRAEGIRGWRRGIALRGRPDFVFAQARLAIFIDGCFWHGCRCRRLPTRNRDFWREKFRGNQTRDRQTTNALRRTGWNVIRVWEHQLKKSPDQVLQRVTAILKRTL